MEVGQITSPTQVDTHLGTWNICLCDFILKCALCSLRRYCPIEYNTNVYKDRVIKEAQLSCH
jgi:hypothetical protein